MVLDETAWLNFTLHALPKSAFGIITQEHKKQRSLDAI
jgi:hypothetical protein